MNNELKYGKLRDAQGNVMATYEKKTYNNTEQIFLSEQHIYGSSRLGMRLPNGDKNYELTNHLGNVLAVISDTKNADGTAKLVSTSDYYPFGMQMPSRTYNSTDYRYSFNSQEKTPELNPSHTTALFWEYDGRLGRRWNIDPIKKQHESSYAAFANNPIWFIDPLGNDTILFNGSGKFANKKLKDEKNDFDVLVKVSNKELKKGQINYKKDGSLRSRHLNMQTTKDGFTFYSTQANLPYFKGRKRTDITNIDFNPQSMGEESYRVYEFLQKGTSNSIEFSYIFYYQFNAPRLKITSSQERGQEHWGSFITRSIIDTDGSAIFVHIHSHPIPQPGEEPTIPSDSDKKFQKGINERQQKQVDFNPSYYIYHKGVLYDY